MGGGGGGGRAWCIYMILVSENDEITVNLWGTEWGPC